MHVDPRPFSADAIDASTRAANELLEKRIAQPPPMTAQTPAQIRARVFRHAQPRGVYLHIHAGGWTPGGADHPGEVALRRSEAVLADAFSGGTK